MTVILWPSYRSVNLSFKQTKSPLTLYHYGVESCSRYKTLYKITCMCTSGTRKSIEPWAIIAYISLEINWNICLVNCWWTFTFLLFQGRKNKSRWICLCSCVFFSLHDCAFSSFFQFFYHRVLFLSSIIQAFQPFLMFCSLHLLKMSVRLFFILSPLVPHSIFPTTFSLLCICTHFPFQISITFHNLHLYPDLQKNFIFKYSKPTKCKTVMITPSSLISQSTFSHFPYTTQLLQHPRYLIIPWIKQEGACTQEEEKYILLHSSLIPRTLFWK